MLFIILRYLLGIFLTSISVLGFLYQPGHIHYCTYIFVLPRPHTVLYTYFCISRTIYSTVHIFLYYPGAYIELYIYFCTIRTIYSTVHILLYYRDHIQYCTYIFVLPGPYTVLYIYFCTTRAIYSTVHLFLYFPGYIQHCTFISVLPRLYSLLYLFFYTDQVKYRIYSNVPVFLKSTVLYRTVHRYNKVKRMIESILNALMFIQVELINFIEFINCSTIQHACQK